MSRLRTVSGNRFEDILQAAPGALEADAEMYRQIKTGITQRLYSLIGVTVAGLLGLERLVESVKGPLDDITASQVARDWSSAQLTEMEKAVLSYTEKGTLDEGSVRQRDVDALRTAGMDDAHILTIATAIAYHNYVLRAAAVFDVIPRREVS
jgi:alkylhydroperoxidase family enzyme